MQILCFFAGVKMSIKKSARIKTKPTERVLSDEELQIWAKVTDTITTEKRDSKRIPEVQPRSPENKISNAIVRQVQPRADYNRSIEMDRHVRTKIAKGRTQIDVTLDLHGMHLGQAFRALKRIVLSANRQAFRVLIVITGKGSISTASPDYLSERGILRRTVPNWLDSPDFKPYIVGFSAAAERHGGSGAIYVYLRKNHY